MPKPILVSVAITIAFLAGFAVKAWLTQQDRKASEMQHANREDSEAMIRAVEAAYDKAWQQGDLDGIIVHFTNDAIIMSPRGDVAIGKQEIRNLLGEFLNGPARDTKHTGRITRINFLTDDVAVVDGEALIEGGEIETQSAAGHHRFTDILVRSGECWLIADIRACGHFE